MKRDTLHNYLRLKAENKVKRLKGFYFHLLLYLMVNLVWFCVLLFSNHLSTYYEYGFWGMGYGHVSTAVIWGAILVVHYLLISGINLSFSKKWEERKIQEFLEEEKQYWE
ncbi:MAG: histidine kinase [Flavobacteriaceae bacterium]|uniref:2TM domain-containing protein n=1 Tax=Bizionia echini TaxID=649333 RepID=UPI000C8ADA93|nr:histidine kinase [Flavobacteriaceae bacterium]